MTYLQCTKAELQWIILWANQAKDRAETVGCPFESDELAFLDKLMRLRDKRVEVRK